MAMTALGYLIAWGPFASLCIWEMITEPRVRRQSLSYKTPARVFNDMSDAFYKIIFHLQKIPETYRLVVSLFAKSATAYNPFIYFFMFKGFRRDTMNVIKRLN